MSQEIAEYDDFIRHALHWGGLQEQGKYRAGNRDATALEKLGKKLRETQKGQEILLKLIQHASPYVVCWAAKDCLSFAPQFAEPKLKAIADASGSLATRLLASGAAYTLAEWRKGKLFAANSN